MNDRRIIEIIIAALKAGLVVNGFVGPVVKQAFQPRHKGAEEGPTWYINRLSTHKHGYPGRKYTHNDANQNFDVEESRVLEKTFQITTLKKPVDPSDVNEDTAFDMADLATTVMESEVFIQSIFQEGLQILRITDVREPYFVDESKENELSPSFDFTVTYSRTTTSTASQVEEITGELIRVDP